MSKPVLIVDNLHLELILQRRVERTLRDLFVRTLSNPLSLLQSRPQKLAVCHDISFQVYPGERVGIIGPNGAGKTSLCRCLAGFFKPTSGTIHRPENVRALLDCSIGVQPELTGRENARLLAEILAPTHPQIDLAVEEALEFSELGPFLDVPIRQYSKGMQARLGLSVNAMLPADLLILDEVFDGADIFFQKKIAKRMLDLIAQSSAVIFVSHSFEQIRQVCNRVLVLHSGTIVFDGGVEGAFEQILSRGSGRGEESRPSWTMDAL